MLLSTNVKSQHLLEGNARIDSLHTILRDHKEDTGKVKILNDIAFEYNRISPYDGIKYGNESIVAWGLIIFPYRIFQTPINIGLSPLRLMRR